MTDSDVEVALVGTSVNKRILQNKAASLYLTTYIKIICCGQLMVVFDLVH